MKAKLNAINALVWAGVLLVFIAALWMTYALHLTAPVKIIVWIGWFVCSLGLGACSTQGKRLLVFAEEAKSELFKVVWPTRQETVQTTSIVMIMVLVAGFVLWIVDVGMMWAIGKITHLG